MNQSNSLLIDWLSSITKADILRLSEALVDSYQVVGSSETQNIASDG